MSVCGVVESQCSCILPPGHETPHVCACGGSYREDDGGELVVYALPPMLNPDRRITQEQAIADANRYAQRGPLNTESVLGAIFGFDDDDDWAATDEGDAK